MAFRLRPGRYSLRPPAEGSAARVESVEIKPGQRVEVATARDEAGVERSFTHPILALRTGGHRGPVRALAFADDGPLLLSAGMDKIINVWRLSADPPGLARTIRPPIWRGYAGVIYAMALSPTPDRDGQRTLAVAGFGVQSTGGGIGLFRFPGLNTRPTGDVQGQLPSGRPDEEVPKGHIDVVISLAFDPRGKFLCSGSFDRTVRIWDLQARRSVAVLKGHTGVINALANSPDGRRLVTGGADGLVMLWDVDRRVQLNVARPDPRRQRPGAPLADPINALGFSPDGRWIIIGRENGDLIRYDAADLENATLLPRGGIGQGPVEALAISPDGMNLVTSVFSHALTSPGERPRVECDIELRTLPDGVVRSRLARSNNLVYALAFSRDSRRLAFSGGEDHAVVVQDLTEALARPVVLKGAGRTVRDVGLTADGRVVGFAGAEPGRPDAAKQLTGFDLHLRRIKPIDGELRALTAWNGWTVRPVGPCTLDVLDAEKFRYRIELDRMLDRRWWSYSFVPPGPGHPRPALAIGCEAGVAIHGLDDGRQTRLLGGHDGPVDALAPSPDGRRLVTGSSDLTVRLWPLAGCDTLPPLGASFGRLSPGGWRVESVVPRGFAELMGLRVGDLVDKLYVGPLRGPTSKTWIMYRPTPRSYSWSPATGNESS